MVKCFDDVDSTRILSFLLYDRSLRYYSLPLFLCLMEIIHHIMVVDIRDSSIFNRFYGKY